ncbi:hypothetical protein BO70DRAFT_391765 [Aspergillus heteromorphus CBS 117.55]|uniref:Gfd2/YDR514C-like C-terminal domain-containing protein n=1 Tax=Aspergillus heteromorphus CBS 117.55 TaxID=1448321 RepID=A0A317X107_9EURO|nr:uncharacterized protein BO70DRAFT_391765 [Aspergillus heteromorphus CBS 117.55]PWY92349.1 hypothetical protein BO70DRAFT_391765 [Aspergillus heteromorphus CBS 117.55]
MGPEERLKLLFQDDEALFKLNTGLCPPAPPAPIPIPDQTIVNPTTITKETPPPVAPEKTPRMTEPVPAPLPAPMSAPLATAERPAPPSDGHFTPLLVIAKYPYRQIKGELSQQVASRFFDAGKFWNRPWDIYYVYTPPALGSRCILLTPTSHVRRFMAEINRELECSLVLSSERAGFILPFQDSYPQPIYLGRSTSRETKDQLESGISPPQHSGPRECVAEVYAAFEAMMEGAMDAVRSNKKKGGSREKQMKRAMHARDMQKMVRRVQRYLGLRPMETPDEAETVAWDLPNPVSDLPPLAVGQAAPHPFWREPVLVSVDVESNEHCHAQITEVGISVLDTQWLVGVPPGEKGEEWRKRIQSRHLRVHEHRHIVNRDFVVGCPGMFQFGESEWVALRELAEMVRVGLRLDETLQRRVVLVGHSLGSDEQYLRRMGVKVDGFRDRMDTADLFQLLRGEETARSLGGVLAELGMDGWYLHNAGNDARYTMEVLVASVVVVGGGLAVVPAV